MHANNSPEKEPIRVTIPLRVSPPTRKLTDAVNAATVKIAIGNGFVPSRNIGIITFHIIRPAKIKESKALMPVQPAIRTRKDAKRIININSRPSR